MDARVGLEGITLARAHRWNRMLEATKVAIAAAALNRMLEFKRPKSVRIV